MITVTGVLRDPTDKLVAKGILRVTDRLGLSAYYLTGLDGSYSFSIEYGFVLIELNVCNSYERVGESFVDSSCPNPCTIEQLVEYSVPVILEPVDVESPEWDSRINLARTATDTTIREKRDQIREGDAYEADLANLYTNKFLKAAVAEAQHVTAVGNTEVSKSQLSYGDSTQSYSKVINKVTVGSNECIEFIESSKDRNGVELTGWGRQLAFQLNTWVESIKQSIKEISYERNIAHGTSKVEDKLDLEDTVVRNLSKVSASTGTALKLNEVGDTVSSHYEATVGDSSVEIVSEVDNSSTTSSLVHNIGKKLLNVLTGITTDGLSYRHYEVDKYSISDVMEVDTINKIVKLKAQLKISNPDDFEGKPGDTIFEVYQYAETSSGVWKDEYFEGARYRRMNQSINGVIDPNTWSDGYLFVGQDGADGDTHWWEYQYANEAMDGWHDAPMINGDVWRRGRLHSNGDIGAWSDRARIKGDSGVDGAIIDIEYQYSINGLTLWHSNFVTGDHFSRERTRTRHGINDPTPTYTPWSMAAKIVPEKGDDYFDGLNQASILIYRRSVASQPPTPSTALTYTFLTHSLSGDLEGWTSYIPDGVDDLYFATATAVSMKTTDTIIPSEWSAGLLASNGSDGIDASLVRAVYYIGSSMPAQPTGKLIPPVGWTEDTPVVLPAGQAAYVCYTYAVNDTTSEGNEFWSTVGIWRVPNPTDGVDGKSIVPVYMNSKSVPAKPTGSTIPPIGWVEDLPAGVEDMTTWISYTLAKPNGSGTGKWSEPRRFLEPPKYNVATMTLFKESVSTPITPVNTLSYSFVTDILTGNLSGWSRNVPASAVHDVWAVTAPLHTLTNEDNINPDDWSDPIQWSGSDGYQAATLTLYKVSDTVPTEPTELLTYHFALGTLTGELAGWTLFLEENTKGKVWVTQAMATGKAPSPVDNISPSEWTTPKLLVQDGTDGIDGKVLKDVFKLSTGVPARPSGNNIPPTGWTNEPPNSIPDGQRVWVSITYADHVDSVTGSGQWTNPAQWSGNNGVDGKLLRGVYRLAKTKPSKPSGTIVPPSGWTESVPAITTDGVIWASYTYAENNTTPVGSGYWTDVGQWSGSHGLDGTNGIAGNTSYFHVAYADDAQGNGMSQSALGKLFIGTYVDYVQADSNDKTKYKWSKYVGDDGKNGIAGVNGEDGRTSYLHIAYADDVYGTGFSQSPAGKTYIGTYTDFTQLDSSNPSVYTWALFKGVDGINGSNGTNGANGTSNFFHVAYANTITGEGFSQNPTGKQYIGTYVDNILADSTDPKKYAWVLFKGLDGTDGIAGVDGETGKTSYLHIAYADNERGDGFSQSPTGKAYLGQYVDFILQDSIDPSKYVWSLIKGTDGIDGSHGVAGTDGITYYTWLKYADTVTGQGISDNPDGKLYIGLAYNKLVAEESTNPRDYKWSLIKGTDGVDGSDGINGETTYTWIKYSDNFDGLNMYDIPTDNTQYIGLATNKTTKVESSNPRDYVWSRFKGHDGINGVDGSDGVNGDDGVSIVFKGSFPAHPTNPQNGWAYYNTTDSRSYVFQSGQWYQMSVDGVDGANGVNGTDGVSITWKGDLATPPSNPQKNWAYRDTDNGYVYIYTGSAWELMVHDGQNGTDGSNGMDGTDGLSVFITYHDNPSSNRPVKPTGLGNTNGWHTNTSSNVVWMSQKIALSAGAGTWGDAIQIKATDGLNGATIFRVYQHSVDGANWHTDFLYGDRWQRFATSTNGVVGRWSHAYLIVGTDGGSGTPGPAGEDGKTSYFHIAYSDNSDGTSLSFMYSGQRYMGTYVDFEKGNSNDKTKYQWVPHKGLDGTDGINGTNGSNGESSYLHIAYADNATGLNFTTGERGTRMWIGTVVNTTVPDPTDFRVYTWAKFIGENGTHGVDGTDGKDGSWVTWIYKTSVNQPALPVGGTYNGGTETFPSGWVDDPYYTEGQITWVSSNRYVQSANGSWVQKGSWSAPAEYSKKGDDGLDGVAGTDGTNGKTTYFHVAYANTSTGSGFSQSPLGKPYIGTYVDYVATDSSDPKKYMWSKYVGDDGDKGIAGVNGANGETSYLHIAYASTATGGGFSQSPTGKLYIGTYTDFVQQDSNVPSKYTWALIKGADGVDGKTTYFHIAYADTVTGEGFSQNPSNKEYLGTYVDFIQTDSNDPKKYSWSLIKGSDGANGIPGHNGEDGKTSYLHIAYADTVTGGGFSQDPLNKEYIGQYVDFIQADSSLPSKYTWSLIKGADGMQSALVTMYQLYNKPEVYSDLTYKTFGNTVLPTTSNPFVYEFTTQEAHKALGFAFRMSNISSTFKFSIDGHVAPDTITVTSNSPIWIQAYPKIDITKGKHILKVWKVAGSPVLHQINIQAKGIPPCPTEDHLYNFRTGELTLPQTSIDRGWSASIPANAVEGGKLWITSASLVASATVSNTTIGYTQWSNPIQFAGNGQDGTGFYTIFKYKGNFPSDSVATSEFIQHTGRSPQMDDHLTYATLATETPKHSETKRYDGSKWVAPAQILNGDLLVEGTITGNRLVGQTVTGNEIYAGSTINIGDGFNKVMLMGSDPLWRISSGHTDPAKAPFRVDKTGKLYATGATIQGDIRATSGTFTGNINSSNMSGGTVTAGHISGSTIEGSTIISSSIFATEQLFTADPTSTGKIFYYNDYPKIPVACTPNVTFTQGWSAPIYAGYPVPMAFNLYPASATQGKPVTSRARWGTLHGGTFTLDAQLHLWEFAVRFDVHVDIVHPETGVILKSEMATFGDRNPQPFPVVLCGITFVFQLIVNPRIYRMYNTHGSNYGSLSDPSINGLMQMRIYNTGLSTFMTSSRTVCNNEVRP